MKKRHLAIGVIVWLTIAWFGFRWISRPIVWSNLPVLGGVRNLKSAEREFPFHVAKFKTETPILSRGGLMDDEWDPEVEAVRDWAFRETRNRFFIGFLLWMASGWFIQWFVTRIVRGQKDYT
jgi:hypothetical protein